jgi:hypothetical protein
VLYDAGIARIGPDLRAGILEKMLSNATTTGFGSV